MFMRDQARYHIDYDHLDGHRYFNTSEMAFIRFNSVDNQSQHTDTLHFHLDMLAVVA